MQLRGRMHGRTHTRIRWNTWAVEYIHMHTHTHTHTHTRICWNTYTCANHIHTHMLEHIHASARISASRCMSFNTTDKRTTQLWRYQNEAKRFGTSERQNSGDTRMKQNASGQANPTKLCASLSIRKLAPSDARMPQREDLLRSWLG